MGLCIVGGLIVAQVLTLFCTPVFYIYMEYFQERHLDKIAFFKRGRRRAPRGSSAAPVEGVLSNNVPAAVNSGPRRTCAGACRIRWPLETSALALVRFCQAAC